MTFDELEQLTAEVYRAADFERLDELRAAIRELGEHSGSARGHAVVGGAWLVAFKLSHDRNELALAVTGLERAHALEPTPSRASNLAAALLERSGLPGRGDADGAAADHARAVALLEGVVTETPIDDDRCVRSAGQRHRFGASAGRRPSGSSTT